MNGIFFLIFSTSTFITSVEILMPLKYFVFSPFTFFTSQLWTILGCSAQSKKPSHDNNHDMCERTVNEIYLNAA